MDRGIIIADPVLQKMTNGHSDGWIRGNEALSRRLRYCLLYWDQVKIIDSDIYPLINTGLIEHTKRCFDAGINVGVPQYYEELLSLNSAGIIDLPRIRLDQLSGAENFDSKSEMLESLERGGSKLRRELHLRGLAQQLNDITAKERDQWTVNYDEKPLTYPADCNKDLITANLQLISCLPSPLEDTPIADVLEFKERRKSELVALRYGLDDFDLSILKSQDIPRVASIEIERLKRAITDLNAVAKESWARRVLASSKVSLDINMGSISSGLVAGGLIGKTFNTPLGGVCAMVIQSIAASLKLQIDLTPHAVTSNGTRVDLSYISSMKDEAIIHGA